MDKGPRGSQGLYTTNGKRVSRKRDLSIQERIDYGDILFPPPSKYTKVVTTTEENPTPSTSASTDTTIEV